MVNRLKLQKNNPLYKFKYYEPAWWKQLFHKKNYVLVEKYLEEKCTTVECWVERCLICFVTDRVVKHSPSSSTLNITMRLVWIWHIIIMLTSQTLYAARPVSYEVLTVRVMIICSCQVFVFLYNINSDVKIRAEISVKNKLSTLMQKP